MVKKIIITLIGIVFLILAIYWLKRPISLGKIEIKLSSTNLTHSQIEKQVKKVIHYFERKELLESEKFKLTKDLTKDFFYLKSDSLFITRILNLNRQSSLENESNFFEKNKMHLFRLFFKLLNHVVYLRNFHPMQKELIKQNTEAAKWIADHFEKSLKDNFLQSEYEYYKNLEPNKLKKKLKLELCYRRLVDSLYYGNSKNAERFLGAGLKFAKELNDKRMLTDYLSRLHFILYQSGLTNTGLALGGYILESAKKMRYRIRRAWTLFHNGNILIDHGEFQKSLINFENARIILSEYGNQRAEANMYERLGLVYRRLAKFDNALDNYKKFLEIQSKFDASLALIRYHLGIGLVKFEMAEYQAAEFHYNESIKIARKLRDRSNEAVGFSNLGELYFELGDYDKAIQFLNKALELKKTIGNPHMIASSWMSLTEVYAAKKDYKKAKSCANKAFDQISKTDFGLLNAQYFLNIGNLQLRLGQMKLALKSFQQAFENFKQIEVVRGQIETLNLIGETYRRMKMFDSALKVFQHSFNLAQNLPQPIQHSNIHLGFGRIYKDLNKIPNAESHLKKAIGLIESIADSIYSDEHRSNYTEKIQPIFEEMVLLQLAKNDAKSAFLFSERERAQAFRILLQGKSRMVQNREFVKAKVSINPVHRVNNSVLTLESIQAQLQDGITVVKYEITDSLLVIWIIGNKMFHVDKVNLKREELDHWISEFRKNTKPENLKNPEQLYSSFDKIMTLGQRFYEYLISPIEKYITNADLIYFIPDETLHYLPFAATITPKNRFLIEDLAIATIPSAAILQFCLEKKRQKEKIFSNNKKLLSVAAQLNLLGAIEEARTVAKMQSFSDTLFGPKATEEALRKILLKKFGILLFSTHGKIDEKRPYYSSLTLHKTSDDNSRVASPENDGFLRIYEIHQLKLSSTDLVYLSTCESAHGRLYRGEGIVGMQRAFMIAGANSVIANLWKVDDAISKKLTIEFFNYWFNKNFKKVEALRQSQLKIINWLSQNPLYKYPHPYFWAAVTLTGAYY